MSSLAVGCGVGEDEFALDQGVCSDAFKVTGSFAANPPRPATMPDPNDPTGQMMVPFRGCYPVGTWTFTASTDPELENVLDVDLDGDKDRCGTIPGTAAATVDGTYSFTVTRVEGSDGQGPQDSYTLVGATQEGDRFRWNDKILFRLKVTEGGGGECEGGLELFSADGKKYWNMKPALTVSTITGFGDYKLFEKSQLDKPQS